MTAKILEWFSMNHGDRHYIPSDDLWKYMVNGYIHVDDPGITTEELIALYPKS